LREEKQLDNLQKFKLFLLPESWQCQPNFTIINCSSSNLCRTLKKHSHTHSITIAHLVNHSIMEWFAQCFCVTSLAEPLASGCFLSVHKQESLILSNWKKLSCALIQYSLLVWALHSVKTSARFSTLSWYQRTLFSVYAGANWEAITLFQAIP